MAHPDPPVPPRRTPLSDDHPLRRVQFRLWQIVIAAVTIFVTCWTYTIHPALGLTATFLAKHILVAVLAAGFDLPEVRQK